MENFALTLHSKTAIDDYLTNNHLMRYEREIMAEIVAVIEIKDAKALAWFAGFGDSLRQILMNVNEHRRALEFGFTEITFNPYGWYEVPNFLDREVIKLEQSEIRISGVGRMVFGLML